MVRISDKDYGRDLVLLHEPSNPLQAFKGCCPFIFKQDVAARNSVLNGKIARGFCLCESVTLLPATGHDEVPGSARVPNINRGEESSLELRRWPSVVLGRSENDNCVSRRVDLLSTSLYDLHKRDGSIERKGNYEP
jgi:hypothetical protein